MTSTELYNLVRDVRRDAWPTFKQDHGADLSLTFLHDQWNLTTAVGQHIFGVPPSMVETLFVGSMAAEVVKRGGEITGMPAQVTIEDKEGQLRYFTAPTLIEALAAALKEVQ
jgi:hypothetical protein